MARACTVCSAGLIRGSIEQQHLGGWSVRAIAADPSVAAAGLHEASIRRHLAAGHQLRNNRFTPPGLDDSDFSASDVVGGVAAGIRRMLELRDQPGTTSTSAVRAQAEARQGLDSLAKVGVVDGERLGAQLAGWKDFIAAERAYAQRDPDAAEEHGRVLVEIGHPKVGDDFIKLATSVRERNAAKATKENE